MDKEKEKPAAKECATNQGVAQVPPTAPPVVRVSKSFLNMCKLISDTRLKTRTLRVDVRNNSGYRLC